MSEKIRRLRRVRDALLCYKEEPENELVPGLLKEALVNTGIILAHEETVWATRLFDGIANDD